MLQTSLKKPLTIAAIIIGLSLVLGLGGSYVLGQYLSTQTAAITAARIEAARVATLAPRITQLKTQEATAASYERVIGLLLPTQEALFEMPRAIEIIGQSHSVNVVFKFLGSADAGETKAGASLPFSILATGSPTNLQLFLDDIELKNPRYTISIGGIDMTGGAIDANTGQLSANGIVFYR